MLANKLMSALSGGAEDKLYVDDVFSAYTYTGNGSTQTINNGIDLAGKGGLVWIKERSTATGHYLFNTISGKRKFLYTNTTDAETSTYSDSYDFGGFNNNGFSLQECWTTNTNVTGNSTVSWTFRKAPKFFDVVTYTGNGASSRAIAHSLGKEVGMVMTKATSTAGDWNTYHRSATGDLVLDTAAAQTGSKALVNSATTSIFTVSGAANTNAVTYVAYLFAHDPSADGIIQCGSATEEATVTLGWEPQFVLIKRTDSSSLGQWTLHDVMRDWSYGSPTAMHLAANESSAESSGLVMGKPTATGFTASMGTGTGTFIYMAIRRPNKPPTTGTEVYNAIARTGTGTDALIDTGVGFAPDWLMYQPRARSPTAYSFISDRLRGVTTTLATNYNFDETAVAIAPPGLSSFDMNGISVTSDPNGIINRSGIAYINHFFKRAPGFFDVVCYKGTGVAKTEAHGLGVVPELMVVKARSLPGQNWQVYFSGFSTNQWINLDLAGGLSTNNTYPRFTSLPTSSQFTVAGNAAVNSSGATYVAYLFASLPGISKVGSYTGNGTTQTINCGFATGARFILIKRTDSTGDWYVWDTARGIISANDPHLSLNTAAAEVTTEDSVDPEASGFIVNQVAATNINVSGGTYIFLAIA